MRVRVISSFSSALVLTWGRPHRDAPTLTLPRREREQFKDLGRAARSLTLIGADARILAIPLPPYGGFALPF